MVFEQSRLNVDSLRGISKINSIRKSVCLVKSMESNSYTPTIHCRLLFYFENVPK